MTILVSERFDKAANDGALATLNSGTFKLLTSADAELAVLGFGATAFNASAFAGGVAVATAATLSPDTTPVAGTIAKGIWAHSDGTTGVSFSIGTSGTDMVVADNVIDGDASSVSVTGLQFSLHIGG